MCSLGGVQLPGAYLSAAVQFWACLPSRCSLHCLLGCAASACLTQLLLVLSAWAEWPAAAACLCGSYAAVACLLHLALPAMQVFLTQQYLAIAMEYAAGGDMFEHVVRKGGLKESEARWFFQQLIVGVDYVHRMVSSVFRAVDLGVYLAHEHMWRMNWWAAQ